MALILPILKILHILKKLCYQYSTGGQFLFDNFCCKMETVDFLKRKIRQLCQNVPKTTSSKLKVS